MSEEKPHLYEFGPFRLDAAKHLLFRNGEMVPLTPKVFDTLRVLVERSGEQVTKDQLMSEVWEGAIVEETNLTTNVSHLRKALGEKKNEHRYILTIPGGGYRFVAAVKAVPVGGVEVVMRERTRESFTVEEETVVADESRSIRLPFFLAGASLVLLLAVGGFFLVRRQTQPLPATAIAAPGASATVGTAPLKSIAILPFKPLDTNNRDESLELGMAETLITRLSGLKEVVVRPTSAVRRYNGLEQDALAAGRELQVESVLDGSLQRAGDGLRVTVRLVRVADGQTLWAESFDEKFTDIFAVQDRVAEQVIGLLAVRLTGQEQTLLTKRHTDNTQAYELYLKGQSSSGTEERLKKSVEFFQRAIKLDPSYALAYAGLADIYMKLGSARGFLSPRETFPKAEAALKKALELDETLAEGHELLGTYKLDYAWDWSGAEREFKRAIELNPNNSGAHERYGSYFVSRGQFDEALAERKLARKLDPMNAAVIANVGNTLFLARRYDEAIEKHREALELNPKFSWSHIWIAEVYVQKGMYEEAINEVNKALALDGNTRAIAILGYAYALAGRRDEARKVLGQLEERSKRKYVPHFFIALIHIGLGEKDQAFDWLEKAYQERHPHLINLKVQPVYDPLRADPRFADLVRRVGLPQ